MLKSINKNFRTLYKAIGNEPMTQIFGNVIRKIIGLHPVMVVAKMEINEQKVGYQEYLCLRNKALFKKKIISNKCDLISIVMIETPSSDTLDLAYQSLLEQRVHPHQTLIISQRKGLVYEGAKVYATIDEAIAKVKTDYIVFAHSNHRYHPCFVQELMLHQKIQNVDILHTCYDRIHNGMQQDPQWLPQLNQHLLYSNNYIGNTILVKRSLGDEIHWFKTKNFASSYIYDFIFRAIDHGAIFYCLPDILYSNNKQVIEPIAERRMILKDHIKRNNWDGTVLEGKVSQTLRIKWAMKSKPLVSIIIPFRDKHRLLQDCVESILQKTDYLNYEIILADNRSQELETAKYIQKLVKKQQKITHIRVDMDFNFSAINNYVASRCKGDYLLFLNNDTEVISPSWLAEMVMELQGPKVGAVGAKLLYDDDTVQHAGVIYGAGHVAGHAFRHLPDTHCGHMTRASVVQEYLAVTGACLLTKKEIFVKVGGFDEVNLAIAYNDVDLCLKIVEFGYKIIYTPFSKLYHLESKSREYDLSKRELARYQKECSFMHKKWGKLLLEPFNHENFAEEVNFV